MPREEHAIQRFTSEHRRDSATRIGERAMAWRDYIAIWRRTQTVAFLRLGAEFPPRLIPRGHGHWPALHVHRACRGRTRRGFWRAGMVLWATLNSPTSRPPQHPPRWHPNPPIGELPMRRLPAHVVPLDHALPRRAVGLPVGVLKDTTERSTAGWILEYAPPSSSARGAISNLPRR